VSPRQLAWRRKGFSLFYRHDLKEYGLQLVKMITLCSLLLLTACATNKAASEKPGDYVEIENPGYTMSPGAPPTIWVPRSYVESGPPRGGELVKKGYEKVAGTSHASSPQQAPAVATPASAVQPPAAKPEPQPVAAPIPLKNRISVLEIGENGLLQPFTDRLRGCAAGVILDPAQPAFLAKYSTVSNQAERGAFAVRLQQEYGATVAVFIAAPDQVAPGKTVQGEVYDGMGGGLVRTVSAVIPAFASSDAAAREAALGKALTDLAGRVREVAALLPWYGKIVAVEGDRAYVNAGKEAGLKVGQVLKVYHPGKVVAGLGFVPGERAAALEVSGFIGTNGAYGVIKDGKGVQANDLVAVE
jgi:hypothetical protein